MAELIAGENPILHILQQQAELCWVRSRELTGVGFMAEFGLPAHVERLRTDRDRVILSGVNAEIAGLTHGAGFVLYINRGLIDALEGFSYDEPWPTAVGAFVLSRGSDRERELERFIDALASESE